MGRVARRVTFCKVNKVSFIRPHFPLRIRDEKFYNSAHFDGQLVLAMRRFRFSSDLCPFVVAVLTDYTAVTRQGESVPSNMLQRMQRLQHATCMMHAGRRPHGPIQVSDLPPFLASLMLTIGPFRCTRLRTSYLCGFHNTVQCTSPYFFLL